MQFAKLFPKFNSLKVKNVPRRNAKLRTGQFYEDLPRYFPQLASLVVEDPYFRLDDHNLGCVSSLPALYRLQANMDEDLVERLFDMFEAFDLSFETARSAFGRPATRVGTNCTQPAHCTALTEHSTDFKRFSTNISVVNCFCTCSHNPVDLVTNLTFD